MLKNELSYICINKPTQSKLKMLNYFSCEALSQEIMLESYQAAKTKLEQLVKLSLALLIYIPNRGVAENVSNKSRFGGQRGYLLLLEYKTNASAISGQLVGNANNAANMSGVGNKNGPNKQEKFRMYIWQD